MALSEREIILGKLMVLWSRTIREHKLGFEEWLRKHAG